MLNECVAELGDGPFIVKRDDEGLWAVGLASTDTGLAGEAAQRLCALRDGHPLDEVYGREWCFDRAAQFRADLSSILLCTTLSKAKDTPHG